MTRYVIIGAGVAAVSAAEAIRAADRTGDIWLVSDDPFGYYSRPGLAYYLSGELAEEQLFPYQKEDFQKLRLRLVRARACRIVTADQVVELEPAASLRYDRLLIASGAQALPLKVSGAHLRGVYKLDHLEDARALLSRVRRGQAALVTGGGITALELAEGLAARGARVHYILRGERYWSSVLDEGESRLVEHRLQADGIILHHQAEILEITGKNGWATGARLSNGLTLRADLVAYAIGITPRTSLAAQAGISCERGILVDQYLCTNQPAIFAAGDAAQVFDPASGRYVLDSLWNPAREQGRIAGLNMTGQAAVYAKPAAFNVTRLSGLTTTIIGAVGGGRDDDLVGIARGDSETWRFLPDAIIAQSDFEVNRLRLMVGRQHILGAVVMGDQTLSAPLQTIIRCKIDISAIRSALLAPRAPIADILVDFWAASPPL